MIININDVEKIKAKTREEAVTIIKEKMKQWMQMCDQLIWTVREGKDKDTEPGFAQVYNALSEPTDAFAEITSMGNGGVMKLDFFIGCPGQIPETLTGPKCNSYGIGNFSCSTNRKKDHCRLKKILNDHDIF